MIKGVIRFFEGFLEENKKAIALLILLVSAISGILGWRYYKHSAQDPEFCGTCHMMQESFRDWQKSTHRDIICQDCHRMRWLEQNRLLIAYTLRNYTAPGKHVHGRLEPWEACKACHIDDVRQGHARFSSTHARHIFQNNIGCIKCHPLSLHNFKPDEKACKGCHPLKDPKTFQK